MEEEFLDIKNFESKQANSNDFLLGVDSAGIGFKTPVPQNTPWLPLDVGMNLQWNVTYRVYNNVFYASAYGSNLNMSLLLPGNSLFTIPSGIRPYYDLFFPATFSKRIGASPTANMVYPMNIAVYSNGEVHVSEFDFDNFDTGNTIRCFITYPIGY